MLSTRGLTKIYPGPVTALNGIDLDVPPGTVQNIGTGTMPVEVAAVTGERWKKSSEDGPQRTYTEDPAYRDARATVTLGAGESRELSIRCDFEPEKVVVDPDVRVLQLKRKQATATL